MRRVFLDTNIMLEVLCKRRFCQPCEQIIQAGRDGEIMLSASFLSFANMAYILHREKMNRTDIYRTERTMESMMEVLPMDVNQLRASLSHEVKDFEDMLQYQCAVNGQCDCIVTINTADFQEFSILPVYTPDELLDLLDADDE